MIRNKIYNTIVIVDASFGDSGKGKIVDYLASDADMVVKYNGGPNSGRTVYTNGKKHIFRLIPSGILHPSTICVMAQGMVIDPLVLKNELQTLAEIGINVKDRLFISDAAHLIMPYHILADSKQEEQAAIGTTKKGIGPAYEDKVARRGIRLGDLRNLQKAENIAARAKSFWRNFIDLDYGSEAYLTMSADVVLPFLTDTSILINQAINLKKKVLFESAQGTLLDIDHGTYPYVTSSSAVAGGACTGAGVGPTRIKKVMGITKAYTTRVGAGPFDTEIDGILAERLREVGNEYGSVTKRPRRVGWLDLPALKYAAEINGLTGLIVTKLDTLSNIGMKNFYIRSEYDADGGKLDSPRLRLVDGWDQQDLSQAKTLADLPDNTLRYLEMIEDEVEVPIYMASVGSDRNQIIPIHNIWE